MPLERYLKKTFRIINFDTLYLYKQNASLQEKLSLFSVILSSLAFYLHKKNLDHSL